eukprot:TRINITY_DN12535_c1_g1_i2.p1 TRINITY_DN12535_c1_g1~~TRINITY_DN12535_c1_g1_i2.p1  ORF type:complete len:440 (+),score=127.14 TRINITY_DN12535_c1_g1_i2:2701-4020(+)
MASIMEPSETRPRRSSFTTVPAAQAKKKGHAPRARPSKAGHARHGGWGSIQDQINLGSAPDIPDYDDIPSSPTDDLEHVDVELTAVELERLFKPLIVEYADHMDTMDLWHLIRRVHLGAQAHRVVELIVDVALDHEAGGREMYSQLLAKLQVDQLIDEPSFEAAYNTLVERVDDLMLDVPDAVDALAKFMARSVADDCLPPAYVNNHARMMEVIRIRSRHTSRSEPLASPQTDDNGDNEDEEEPEVVEAKPAHYVLRKANKLLTMPHAFHRLNQVWGVCGPQLPVAALRKRVTLLLDEFISSQDLAEAERCLKDLSAPHFHHELVYQTLCRIMEGGHHQEVVDSLTKLLEYLSTTNDISEDQMNEGVGRIYSELPELEVDMPPRAYDHLRDVLDLLLEQDNLSEDMRSRLPAPSRRRRFFSENDAERMRSQGRSRAKRV